MAKGILTQAELCRLMMASMKDTPATTKRGRNVTPQAISAWENGEVVPSWENLAILCSVLQTDEEEILFGKERNKQLRSERYFMARVNEDEGRLLTTFREASKDGQRAILESARSLANALPAPEAQIHPLRRKDDRRTD
jgi:transcriptional regulator with XRE-family HTH domain